jgi:xanthine dehydrogenase YagT iron-sulfur-binding subunit
MTSGDAEHDTTAHETDSGRTTGFGVLSRREFFEASEAAAAASFMPLEAAAGQPARRSSQEHRIRLMINGEVHSLSLDPRQSLLDLLRERLDLTGTKKGCNQGACGACTVLLNGRRVNACLVLAAMHDGSEVTTIEGLASGESMHPLQAAFIKHDGLQCGYCTPGQIMSGVACIAEGHAGSTEEIKFWMSGNICRCAAYPGIVAAVSQVAREN